MANAITLVKQPWEVIPGWVNFSKNMADGESIAVGSSSVLAFDSDGEDVTSDLVESGSIAVVEDTKLQASIKAGVDKQDYKLTFRAYISAWKRLEEDVNLRVRD